jgi:hypothetical protein
LVLVGVIFKMDDLYHQGQVNTLRNPLSGSSFILMGIGTVEILRSIQAALIELGANVYWQLNAHPIISMDRRIDAVISLNLLSCGIEYIDTLRAVIDVHSPKASIIDISLAHPVLETLALELGTIDKINDYLTQRSIVTWVMCRESADEYKKFGLVNGIYQPLGFHPVQVLEKSGANWLVNQWYQEGDPLFCQLYSDNFKNFADEITDDIKKSTLNKILYLASPTIAFEDKLPIHTGKGVEFLRKNYLPNTKALYAELLGYDMRPGDFNEFIAFHYSWMANVPLQRRRISAKELKEIFGDRVSIMGDGWDQFISDCFPTSVIARLLYSFSACCMDFGSLQFSGPFYPRSLEILKSGGLLISGNADGLGKLGNSFTNIQEARVLIERAFDPHERIKMLENQQKLINQLSLTKNLIDLLEEIKITPYYEY